MLAAVFSYNFKSVFESKILTDLIRAFAVEVPRRTCAKPSWDLDKVLSYLSSEKFLDMNKISFELLTKKVLFLVALAIAKRVAELQTLSNAVPSRRTSLVLFYISGSVTKADSWKNLLPRNLSFPH